MRLPGTERERSSIDIRETSLLVLLLPVTTVLYLAIEARRLLVPGTVIPVY